MKSQQTDLEPARSQFLAALADKAKDLHRCLQDFLDLPQAQTRDDLRRRCHALATSARLFEMHELEEISRSAVSMLDVLRDDERDPTDEEADFFGTMIGRIQSLATSRQTGSSSASFRLASRGRKSSGMDRVPDDSEHQRQRAEIAKLLSSAQLDTAFLYQDALRQRCEQMGAPHLGVLQRLRDGTPPQDLLADRVVDLVVFRETLEAMRALGALRESQPFVENRALVQSSRSASASALETSVVSGKRRGATRFAGPQWFVLAGVVVAIAFLTFTTNTELSQKTSRESTNGTEQVVAAASAPTYEPEVSPALLAKTGAVDDATAAHQPQKAAHQPQKAAHQPQKAAGDAETAAVLQANQGELEVLAGATEGVTVKVRGQSFGQPPVRLVLDEGLHTIVFETPSGVHYRFWHVRKGERRQVSAP